MSVKPLIRSHSSSAFAAASSLLEWLTNRTAMRRWLHYMGGEARQQLKLMIDESRAKRAA
jgi:hypothetical protein